MTIAAKANFIKWAQRKAPAQYARIVGNRRGLGALQVVAAPAVIPPDKKSEYAWIDSTFDALIKGLPGIIGGYQAKELVDLNIKRAQAGLDPIDGTGIAPQVNIGIPKNLQYILWAGVGIGALLLLRK